eukprot:311126-Rhodomonas_salina.2
MAVVFVMGRGVSPAPANGQFPEATSYSEKNQLNKEGSQQYPTASRYALQCPPYQTIFTRLAGQPAGDAFSSSKSQTSEIWTSHGYLLTGEIAPCSAVRISGNFCLSPETRKRKYKKTLTSQCHGRGKDAQPLACPGCASGKWGAEIPFVFVRSLSLIHI